MIITYQTTDDKGIHWVSYCQSTKGWKSFHTFMTDHHGYYFDSYGIPPLKDLEKYVKEYNKIQIQDEGILFIVHIIG